MIFIDEFAPQLGNRLFQMAAAINLADRNLDTVCFPDWKYNSVFGITPTPLTHGPDAMYKEPHFNYAPIPYRRNLQLSGYFQSEKYFLECEKKIRSSFSILPEFRKNVNNSLSRFFMESSGMGGYQTCSIHVRRGDYAQFPDHHPMLDISYFNNAINYIVNKTTGYPTAFFIFSDDVEWCKSNFPNSDQFTIMQGSVIEDFTAMSSCDHNIISNSSYSWWGAWLNSNPNKRVIAPSRWFGDALSFHNTKDLIPNDWIVI